MMTSEEYARKINNRRKAAWSRKRWANDPEWRERQKQRWRERYYRAKKAKVSQ